MRERPVRGRNQAHRAGLPSPLDALGDRVAPARPVDLEEQLRVAGDNLFDRLAGERGQSHRRAARRSGPRHGHFTVWVDRLHAGGRDDYRQGNILPHNGCRQITLLDRPDHMRRETQLTERLDIVGDGHPFFAGGHQRGIDRFRQSPFRPLLRDGDRLKPDVTAHG
jgi:hypothetical protein